METIFSRRTRSSTSADRPQQINPATNGGWGGFAPNSVRYPFGVGIELISSEFKFYYEKFESFRALAPLFPDLDALTTLGLRELVQGRLIECGLRYMFDEDPGTYKDLVKEFVASFKAEWSKDGRVVEDRKDAKCTTWKFCLGGHRFSVPSERINELFMRVGEGQARNAIGLDVLEYERNDFWKMITGTREEFSSGVSANTIQVPQAKYIHRLLTVHFHGRMDGGRSISTSDLNLLKVVMEGSVLDMATVLAAQFERYKEISNKAKGLCGGPFITMIARRLGFDLSRGEPEFDTPLTLERLSNMKMYDLTNRAWIVRGEIPKRTKDKLERRKKVKGVVIEEPQEEEVQQEEEPGEQEEENEYEEILRRLGALEVEQKRQAEFGQNFAGWHNDVMSWQGNMFSGLYNHFGIQGYAPPPPTTWMDTTGRRVNNNQPSDEISSAWDIDGNRISEERRQKRRNDRAP